MNRLLLWGAVLVWVTPAFAQATLNRSIPAPGKLPPIAISIEADGWDACASNGVIEGLDTAGDGFLAVRGGPSTNYGVLDHLYNGDLVYVCNSVADWYGIVYTRNGSNCNVSSSWVTSQPYTGPCYSGWVHRNWVNIYAG